jgi:hypothetical protein
MQKSIRKNSLLKDCHAAVLLQFFIAAIVTAHWDLY